MAWLETAIAHVNACLPELLMAACQDAEWNAVGHMIQGAMHGVDGVMLTCICNRAVSAQGHRTLCRAQGQLPPKLWRAEHPG